MSDLFFSDAFRELLRQEIKKALAEIQTPSAWLSQQEAAAHCGVNVATVRNWHRQGLRFQRLGRVTRYARSDLDAFLRRNAHKDPNAWAKEILAGS